MRMSISGRHIHHMTKINDNYHSHIYSVFEFHSKSVPKKKRRNRTADNHMPTTDAGTYLLFQIRI